MNPVYEQFKLNRNVPIPLYYQIKTFFIEQIRNGMLADGELLPPEEELCTLFDVSRPTIRQAFTEMVHEGYLNRIKSKGTFITYPKLSSDFTQKIQTFAQEIEALGLIPRTEVLHLDTQPAMDEVKMQLKLTDNDSVICLERIRYANQQPVVHVRTFLPERSCSTVLQEDLASNSLYQTLDTKCNIRVARLTRQIQAALADPYIAGLLHLPENAPVLYIATVAYDENGIPFEYSLATYRGDLYKMNVDLYKEKI